MTNQTIHFGTSGWRGVIADEFTFGGVRRASTAVAKHVLAQTKSPTLVVGYDTRFFSPEFARVSASVLQAHGCRIVLCQDFTPTPVIAHAIIVNKLAGGVNITASHNPFQYNGLKYSGPEGGPASVETTRDIEERAAALPEDATSYQEIMEAFEAIHPREAYFGQLKKMIRFDVLVKANGNFVYDAVHGCGAGWLDRILKEHGIAVTEIRATRDVLFEGKGPDPSEENLGLLKKTVLEKKALAGLATDGDADRFGILDRDGSFIDPNHILGLAFDYLLETRGYKLGASRSVATSHILDAVAKLYGVPIYESPVGFKYVGPFLREDKIALGGEESAGMTIRGHLPEKDGILACLLVAEMIAARQASLREQLQNLFRRAGREYWPVRVNLPLSDAAHKQLVERLKGDPKEFAGRKVVDVNRLDGLKLGFEDGSWVLMRPSGTEPVVRIYAETSKMADSQKLAEEARQWIMN